MVSSLPAWSQGHSFSGRVVEKETGDPVEFATVLVNATEQWAVTDAEGRFSIQNIKAGKSLVTVASLGYATLSREFSFAKDIADCKLQLEADNLLLQSAVVTAKENDNAATTSRTIDRTALEHVQVMNVGDIASLLPGGVTTDNNLVNRKEFNIRAGDRSESGNASFGTAVEVDGVRLSNNASYSETRGVSTNSIASSNVESVEVITGVPSVEYGDMGSGVVKINTKKGKTPWMVTLSTSPKTKQASFSKGFELGKTRRNNSRGILNASAEYTRSVSDVMSPYESYDRKSLSLIYSNSFTDGAFRNRPLRISVGVTGNLGGLDDKADPDKMVGTFATVRDNALRANLNANWLLSLPWITNIELTASTAISDKLSRERKNYYSSVSDIALHTRETGYYMSAPYAADGANDVVMIPPGSRYSTLAVDDRPVTAKATLKANWAAHWGRVNNKIKLGADWNFDANLGVGAYAEDPATAPTWREYRYCDNPAMHNLAAYAEDNLSFPLGKGHVNVIAGLRADNTFIKGSAYGTTSSLSPRFNVKYTVLDSFGRSREFVRELAVRASWGVAVKLPSFSVLFPTPSYQDINVFTATATADNTVYRAYYVLPRTIEYNPALRWQRNRQGEAGIEANLAGTRVSLAAFYNQTLNAYRLRTEYDRFTYNNTGTAASQGLSIPAENRVFSIDGTTGIVTVTDKTGAQPSQTLASELRKQLIPKTTADNARHPVTRWGLEWVVDFRKIESIGTTVRLDGSYYSYKTLDTDMKAYAPYSQTASGGIPYPYIGFFYGGNGYSNGSETRTLRNNVTITTHIPKVRMIVSVKLEASLLRYSRSLSEREGATRTYVLRDRSNLLSYDPSASIYDGDSYAVTYPDYYVSYDDPDTQVPFLEKLSWAKENAPTLYADLSKLVTTTSYRYMFDKDYISPYFSANFSITKELGDRASVSFYANNFFNNMGQVYSTKERNYKSVSTYIPTFYYGLTVRIKF
jgi:hypothetical protein